MATQQWEYHTDRCADQEDLGWELNRLGKEGWELVNFQWTNPGCWAFTMKRPLPRP